MNTLLNGQRDQDVEDMHTRGSDREITLGTMTILGIFFALAVLCAGFFGFGYSTGRRTLPPVSAAGPASSLTSGAPKPSPFSSLNDQPPAPESFSQRPYQAVNTSAPQDLPHATAPKPAPIGRVSTPDSDPDAAVVGAPAPTRAVPVQLPISTNPAPVTASPSAPGLFMVQVAAVSHPEDADLLVNTLKRVHYDVAVHHESQDKLLHVQIGPFTNRKDADAMRQRLLGDGFNAIVK
jgi:DedD protein